MKTTKKAIDMVGKKIGHLTILERVEPPEGKENQGQTWWLCKCDCGRGRTVIKSGSALRATKNASCGCVSGRIKEKYNSYVFKENYIEVYDLNHRKFLIDIEDYESVRRFNWRVDKNGYVSKASETKEAKNYFGTMLLHRFLLQPEKGFVVDHINHKPWDNRRENLRICQQKDNMRNISKTQKNKSGVIGVYYCKPRNTWVAQISVNNKITYLGSSDNFEEAVKLRLYAEKKYCGEFAPQKELFDKYNIK